MPFCARTKRVLLLQSPQMNRLLFGDNPNWLRNREILPDPSVDRVYLDPTSNLLLEDLRGFASQPTSSLPCNYFQRIPHDGRSADMLNIISCLFQPASIKRG